jgi:hypothetical protein
VWTDTPYRCSPKACASNRDRVTAAGWLAILGVYLAGHFLLYAVKLRFLPAFGTENVIFRYHLWSAVAVTLGAIGVCIASTSMDSVALVVAAVSAHGIYSTSFLELWSLAEGGYSLEILRTLKVARRTGRTIPISEFHAIGARKKGNRIRALLKLRLARDIDGHLELTGLGRCAGLFLGGVAWAANVVEFG